MIDSINQDKLTAAGWDADNKDKAAEVVASFRQWIEAHLDEITALQIFYNQPYRRRELTFKIIKEVLEKIREDKPLLAPLHVWRAYEQLGVANAAQNGSPKNELIALVSLIRHICGIDPTLTTYDKTVDRNFQDWVFRKQAGELKFSAEQMAWLRMMKEHIAASFHLEREDLDYTPFDANGGLGRMWQLFGEKTDEIINELNEVLAA